MLAKTEVFENRQRALWVLRNSPVKQCQSSLGSYWFWNGGERSNKFRKPISIENQVACFAGLILTDAVLQGRIEPFNSSGINWTGVLASYLRVLQTNIVKLVHDNDAGKSFSDLADDLEAMIKAMPDNV